MNTFIVEIMQYIFPMTIVFAILLPIVHKKGWRAKIWKLKPYQRATSKQTLIWFFMTLSMIIIFSGLNSILIGHEVLGRVSTGIVMGISNALAPVLKQKDRNIT